MAKPMRDGTPSATRIPPGQTPNMYFVKNNPFWQVSSHMVMSIVLGHFASIGIVGVERYEILIFESKNVKNSFREHEN